MTIRFLSRSCILLGFLLLPIVVFASNEHEVKKGDSIAKIARFYGVTQSALMRVNGIGGSDDLEIGRTLEIPSELIGNARRKHVVKAGDTVSAIAKKYRVPRKNLRAANRLGLQARLKLGRTLVIPNKEGDPGPDQGNDLDDLVDEKPAKLEWAGGVKGLVVSGTKVEGGVSHIVQRRQTLMMIANSYGINSRRIARKNNISRRNPLKAGNEIFIPDAPFVVPVRTREYQSHLITFQRIKNTKTIKLRLLNKSGSLNQRSRRQLASLLGYKRINPRLVLLLQKVAEGFPGHQFQIISGYRRPNKKRKRGHKPSPHSRNVAVDFRLVGVSNEDLYKFISRLPNVGAGYYPNSTHLHLDFRKKKYLWTDISKKGEPAHYVESGDPGHWDTRETGLEDVSGD
jgi:LysM repeat protein